MKRLILTVLVLLMGAHSWAQTAAAPAQCNMQIRHEVTAPSCYNGMDGRIVLKISGAKAPFTVQWGNGGTGTELHDLAAGLYVATVRDAEGCIKKYELQLSQGKELQGALSIQPKVAGGNTRLTVLFADGSKPYAIQIKDLSKGIKSSWSEYRGEALLGGRYLIEAFTSAGCSQIGKIDLQAK